MVLVNGVYFLYKDMKKILQKLFFSETAGQIFK